MLWDRVVVFDQQVPSLSIYSFIRLSVFLSSSVLVVVCKKLGCHQLKAPFPGEWPEAVSIVSCTPALQGLLGSFNHATGCLMSLKLDFLGLRLQAPSLESPCHDSSACSVSKLWLMPVKDILHLLAIHLNNQTHPGS